MHGEDQSFVTPVFLSMSLLQMSSKSFVEHGRAAFASCSLSDFLQLEFVDLCYLISNQVYGTAASVAYYKPPARL